MWLPTLAPSADLLASVHVADGMSDAAWQRFTVRYRAEMRRPDAARLLDALAALSHQTSFSVGCYCELEARCHRSVLRALLREHGADVAPEA